VTDHKDIDPLTGTETTGHDWDGIKELNNPLPRWWVWTFYVTVLWAVGYWIAMPSWPLVSDYTRGVLGYSQREVVREALEAAKSAQAGLRTRISEADLDAIRNDAELLEFAMAGGRSAFLVNCSQCHGTGGAGAPGYPNLNDDDWLWGGTLDDIYTTVRAGIRSDHTDTRVNNMPAFLRDQILTADQVDDVVAYIGEISGNGIDRGAADRGAIIFIEQCVACHGEGGTGNHELGAPNLTDAIWLYGNTPEDIRRTVAQGRGGVMPAWEDRLDEVTRKQLAVYVHALGGGE